MRVRHVSGCGGRDGKALKAHYVYAMCCISLSHVRRFSLFPFFFLSLHIFQHVAQFRLSKNLFTFSQLLRSLFASFSFFLAFSSLLPPSLCVCVCACLPAVSCIRCSLVALEFPFRLLAVFSCFHLISFASLLCCFCFFFCFFIFFVLRCAQLIMLQKEFFNYKMCLSGINCYFCVPPREGA